MWLKGGRLYFLLFVVQDLPEFPRCDKFYWTAESSQIFFLPVRAHICEGKITFITYCMTQDFQK